MKPSIRLTGVAFLLVLSAATARDSGWITSGISEPAVHVTIIYDNYVSDPSMRTDWGFACVVEYQGNSMLFDAGRDAGLYRQNMQILGLAPAEFDALFISHQHGDHSAGIPWILEENPAIHCYFPSVYEDLLRSENHLPEHYGGFDSPAHISGPFYSTGDHFAAFREQGLVVKTDQGGVLITGCGHPGIVEMVKTAREELGIHVNAVIGGLHLLNTSRQSMEEIAASLKEMGIRQICPTHCTGEASIAFLKNSFGEGYIPGGTGKELIIY